MDGHDYMYMSEAEFEKVQADAKRLNDAIDRNYRAQFMREPMRFIREMLDMGYSDSQLNNILKRII